MADAARQSAASAPSAETFRESGVRRSAKYTLAHTLRRAWTLRGVAKAGHAIYVEPNVKILRHPERVSLGQRVMLKEGVRICPTNPTAAITIGDWTTVGHHTFVFAQAGIDIGPNSLIAPFCYIIDNEHGIEAGKLIREQPLSASPVRIGDGVWLGTGAVVTRGVHIGDGAVVAARSVVTEDVPPNAVVVGIPARVVRYRGDE